MYRSLLPATVALTLSAPPAIAQPAPAPAAVQRLARQVRTADMRGDWAALHRLHADLEALPVTGPGGAWVHYYLGYLDWRRSSLAWLGEGPSGTGGLVRNASGHLRTALTLDSAMVEARALLALTDALRISTERDRSEELIASMRSNLQRATREAPDNPRVRLVRAMLAAFSAATARHVKDSVLNSWHELSTSFPARPAAGDVEWGDAESWGWLGAAHLADGDTARARDAFEHALIRRRDFWWVRSIAMPQTVHGRFTHVP